MGTRSRKLNSRSGRIQTKPSRSAKAADCLEKAAVKLTPKAKPSKNTTARKRALSSGGIRSRKAGAVGIAGGRRNSSGKVIII